MRFDFDGRRYFLQFERSKKSVAVFKDRKEVRVESKYPFTTVTLFELRNGAFGAQGRSTVASATVGCHTNDVYSNAKGRLFALKELSTNLGRLKFPKDFIKAMWDGYNKRGETPKKDSNVIDGQVVAAETVGDPVPLVDAEPGVI